MKTGWKLLMVAGVVGAVLTSQVMAQPGGPGRGMGRGRGMGMGLGRQPGGPMGPGGVLGPMVAQLDLTAEQRDKIRNICQQSRADANGVVEALESARTDLHEAVISGASEEQIRAAAAKLGTTIGNQAVLQAQTIAKAKAVLTPEQLKKFEELKASAPQRRRPMAGPGFAGGPWGWQAHRAGPGFGGGPWGLGAYCARPGFGGGSCGFQVHRAGPGFGGGPRGLGAYRAGPGFGGGPWGLGAYRAGPGGSAAVPHLGLKEMFKRADTNKDGALSLEELRAFQETATANRGPWRQ